MVMAAADGGNQMKEKKVVVVERSRGFSMDAPAVYSFTLTSFLPFEPSVGDRQ